MPRIEKTVFIYYRRKDIAWALNVYQYLVDHGYDVFFDYTGIPSGDFEQIIITNIKARAHFLVILTPTALDRCDQPEDWLHKEIETAIKEKRNNIPLFFDDFSFAAPNVAEKLTGKLATPTAMITPTATSAQPGIGSTRKSDRDEMVMVYVPAGDFVMGSNTDRALEGCLKYIDNCQRDWFIDEEPLHTVSLDAFWIDQTEVTNEQYARCVTAVACTPPSSSSSPTREEYYGNPEYANFPVIWISWDDADTYCTWAGRRLPTEAEWEKAAIGTSGWTYPWGDTIDCSAANYGACFTDTTAVGSYVLGRSPYGAYNMAGNVCEWVAGWYNVYPGGNITASYEFGSTFRVIRGGAFEEPFDELRAANRNFGEPTYTTNNRGFRCASDP